MEIKQFDKVTKGVFKAEENGVEAGFLKYSWSGKNKIIIDHTEVYPDFKGKNIGKLLVMATVNFARESDVKIIPLCTFAKSIFEKTQEINDVL